MLAIVAFNLFSFLGERELRLRFVLNQLGHHLSSKHELPGTLKKGMRVSPSTPSARSELRTAIYLLVFLHRMWIHPRWISTIISQVIFFHRRYAQVIPAVVAVAVVVVHTRRW
jgi:hypothetical protein